MGGESGWNFATDTGTHLSGTIAHEFGHVLGLSEAYPCTISGNLAVVPIDLINTNSDMNEVKLNLESDIFSDELGKGEIMFVNGSANSNDVEMMLEAHCTNKYQLFAPKILWGNIVEPCSTALNFPTIVYYKNDEKKFYLYNYTSFKIIVDGSKKAYLDWLKNEYRIDVQSCNNYVDELIFLLA